MRNFKFVINTSENLTNDVSTRFETPVIDLLSLNFSPARPIAGSRHFQNIYTIDLAEQLSDINLLENNYIYTWDILLVDDIATEITDLSSEYELSLKGLNSTASVSNIDTYLISISKTIEEQIEIALEYGFTGIGLLETLSDVNAAKAAGLKVSVVGISNAPDNVFCDQIILTEMEIPVASEQSIEDLHNSLLLNKSYGVLGAKTLNEDYKPILFASNIEFIFESDSLINELDRTSLSVYVGEERYSSYDGFFSYVGDVSITRNVPCLIVNTDLGRLFIEKETLNYVFLAEEARVVSYLLKTTEEDPAVNEQLMSTLYIKSSDSLELLSSVQYEPYISQDISRYVRLALPEDSEFILDFKLTADMDKNEWMGTYVNLEALPEWMDWRNKLTIETKSVEGTDDTKIKIPSKRFIQPISVTDSSGAEQTIISFDREYIYTNEVLIDDEYIIKFQAKSTAWLISNALIGITNLMKASTVELQLSHIVDFPIDYWNGLCDITEDLMISQSKFNITSSGIPQILDGMIYNKLPIPIAQDDAQFVHSKVVSILNVEEDFQYLTCRLLPAYPYNIWTPLDEWGLILDTPRHDGEGLLRYKARLEDVFNHKIGSDIEGTTYGILRELSPTGMDIDSYLPINEV